MTKNKNWMIKLKPKDLNSNGAYKTFKISLSNDQMTNDVKMSKPNLARYLLPLTIDA